MKSRLLDIMDAQYLPKVKKIVKQILRFDGRPERVSFAKVQKTLGLAQKQFNKLPKCKAYIEKHIESQPEYWAREVEWAVSVLQEEEKAINCSRIMKKTNMRIRDIELCCSHIKNQEIQQIISALLDERNV